MFNHSSFPNVNFVRSTSGDPTLTFTTTRRVPAGTELCICYSADESKLWFSPSYVGAQDGGTTAGPSTRTYQSSPASPPTPSAHLRELARVEIEALQDEEDGGATSSASAVRSTDPEANAAAIAAADEERHARQQRRKRDREEKQRKYNDKQAARRAQAARWGSTAEGPMRADESGIALVNGSSEPGADRTPLPNGHGAEHAGTGPALAPALTDEAYAEVVERLGMVQLVAPTPEQIEAEKTDEAAPVAGASAVGWSLTPRIKGTVEAEQDDESRTSGSFSFPLHSGADS